MSIYNAIILIVRVAMNVPYHLVPATTSTRSRIALTEKRLFDCSSLILVARGDVRTAVVIPAPVEARIAITAHSQLYLVLFSPCTVRLVGKPVATASSLG